MLPDGELIVYDVPCCVGKLCNQRRWYIIGFRNYPRMKPRILWKTSLPKCGSVKKVRFVPANDVMLVDVCVSKTATVNFIWKPNSINLDDATSVVMQALGIRKLKVVL